MGQTRKKGVYKLYMFRHSVSCSNLARKMDNPLDANLYTDPELTREGRALATSLRPYALKYIRKPFATAVSYLMRTHQTAQLLLNPKKMYIIPHISELGRWFQENTPIPADLQAQLLEQKLNNKSLIPLRDYTYYKDDMTPYNEKQQFQEFLKWMGKHLPTITDRGKKSLAVVSHWGFIQDIIKQYTGFEPHKIQNCDLLELDLTIQNGVAKIQNLKRGLYAPESMFEWDSKQQYKDHGCRLSVGPFKERRSSTKLSSKGERPFQRKTLKKKRD
jgi:broad specificity phosphatase PhoE